MKVFFEKEEHLYFVTHGLFYHIPVLIVPAFIRGIQLKLPCTPRTIFDGCQIVHWEPLDAKRRCPQKNGMGYVKMHGFYGNPNRIREWGYAFKSNSYLSCYLS